MSRADLSGADLSWTNLNSANLYGALLDGVNLSAAQYDKDTVWPEGFAIPSDMKFVSEGTTGQEAAPQTLPESLPEEAD